MEKKLSSSSSSVSVVVVFCIFWWLVASSGLFKLSVSPLPFKCHPSRLCTKGSTDFMPSFFFLRLHFGGTAAPHQERMDKILLHTHTTVTNATTNSMEGSHSPPPIHTQTHAGLQLIHATANATAPTSSTQVLIFEAQNYYLK